MDEKMSKQELLSSYRKEITAHIIASLKKGNIPWQKPWNTSGLLPINGISNRRYTGCNVLNLTSRAEECGYKDPRWFTFNQVKKIPDAYVKKGSKATKIIFWETKRLDDFFKVQNGCI